MNKQTLQRVKYIFVICVLLGFLILVMAMDYYLARHINQYLLYTYIGVMFVCVISLFLTIFIKIRKTSYIIFIISFIIYILFHWVPEIKEGYDADACLDSGHGVWDYDEHRCRTDCYHWSKERGCLKKNLDK